MTVVKASKLSSQTCWAMASRPTMRSWWSTRNSSSAYSLAVRAMGRPARVTAWLAVVKARSAACITFGGGVGEGRAGRGGGVGGVFKGQGGGLLPLGARAAGAARRGPRGGQQFFEVDGLP